MFFASTKATRSVSCETLPTAMPQTWMWRITTSRSGSSGAAFDVEPTTSSFPPIRHAATERVNVDWGFARDTFKWHLLDVFRERLDYPDLRRAVIRLRDRYKADAVIMEDACSGKSLGSELKTTDQLQVIMIVPKGSKEERFNGCLGEVEAGHFLLPAEAPWLESFRAELKAFPSGKHDDQVDSFSQFVNYQLGKWRWIMTEHDRKGRPRSIIRLRARPW